MWFALGFLAGAISTTVTFLALRYRTGSRRRDQLSQPPITVTERDYTEAIQAIEQEWGISA